MSEIARLNLTGPVYDPMKGMSQESMSDKIRKNRQAVLSAALSAYQIKGEQHKIEQYEIMQKTDYFMAHNGKDFFNNSASVLRPESWKFTNPTMRQDMLKKWKAEVGGNYKGFSAAYEMAKQNEMNAMAKSMLRGRITSKKRTNKEYAKHFAEQLDQLTDTQKTTLFENVSPELYTQMMTLYVAGGGGPQGIDDTEGFFGYHLENDIGDILVENFDVDRDDWEDWVEETKSDPLKAFIPEHWRDSYRAFTTGNLDEFTEDEDFKWTQTPAYMIEAWMFLRYGRKGLSKLWGKEGIFKGKGGQTSTDISNEAKKNAGSKSPLTTSDKQVKMSFTGKKTPVSGAKKTPVSGAKKTPAQLIEEYKGVTTPKGASVNTKSKWYKKDPPQMKDYKTTKSWTNAWRNWKKANGYPADPSKIVLKKANPAPKSSSTTGPLVTSDKQVKMNLTMPPTQFEAAKKEIAEKIRVGAIDKIEAKEMTKALKKLIDAGDPITNDNLKRTLELAGKRSRGLLTRIAKGTLKFAVIPMAATTAGAVLFQGVGELVGGKTTGQVAGVIGGSASGIASYGAIDLLKRAYNKHGASWIIKKIVAKGGPALAARTVGKAFAGGVSGLMSGGLGIAFMAGFIATDIYAIYQILQQAEADGEI